MCVDPARGLVDGRLRQLGCLHGGGHAFGGFLRRLGCQSCGLGGSRHGLSHLLCGLLRNVARLLSCRQRALRLCFDGFTLGGGGGSGCGGGGLPDFLELRELLLLQLRHGRAHGSVQVGDRCGGCGLCCRRLLLQRRHPRQHLVLPRPHDRGLTARRLSKLRRRPRGGGCRLLRDDGGISCSDGGVARAQRLGDGCRQLVEGSRRGLGVAMGHRRGGTYSGDIVQQGGKPGLALGAFRLSCCVH